MGIDIIDTLKDENIKLKNEIAILKSKSRNRKKCEQEARYFRRLYNNLECNVRQISKDNLAKEYCINENFIYTLLSLELNTREVLKYVQTLPVTGMRGNLILYIVDLLKIIKMDIKYYKEILNGYTNNSR